MALTLTGPAIGPQSAALATLAVVAADGVAAEPVTAPFIHFALINVWKERVKKDSFTNMSCCQRQNCMIVKSVLWPWSTKLLTVFGGVISVLFLISYISRTDYVDVHLFAATDAAFQWKNCGTIALKSTQRQQRPLCLYFILVQKQESVTGFLPRVLLHLLHTKDCCWAQTDIILLWSYSTVPASHNSHVLIGLRGRKLFPGF